MSNGVLRRTGAGLLLAGVLLAGPAGVQSAATSDALSILGRPVPAGSLLPQPAGDTTENDVGVAKIVAPGDRVGFDEYVVPRAEVRNYGSAGQSNVPVVCVFYDSAAGHRVYGPMTIYVDLAPDAVDTVAFPTWVAPVLDRVYFDTMLTTLPGDEDTSNDRRTGRFEVSEPGPCYMTYNDGTFERCISWVQPGGELTERFVAPRRPLTVDKAVLWLSSLSGSDYDAEVRLYGNDGSPHGDPGTRLGAWIGQLHTDTWPRLYRNEVQFDPPLEVDYDTFFVSYYQASVAPAYPHLGMDESPPVERWNDWGCNPTRDTWGVFEEDRYMDFGIDVGIAPLGVTAEIPDAGRVLLLVTPNPLRGRAAVHYTLPGPGSVTLDVYDATGREVTSQTIAAGRAGTASLDLRRLQVGVYMVKMDADGFSTTQKLVVGH